FTFLIAVLGVSLLWVYTNPLTTWLGVLSMVLYAFVYTPLKRVGPIAVFVGAFPGALPPLLGWTAATGGIAHEALIIFGIQFVWQFPHFWAIAWVSDEDYKKAGIRLLPTTKKNKISATTIFFSCILMLLAGFLPLYFGFGGWVFTIVSAIGGLMFVWYGYKHLIARSDASAKKIMYTSFGYLPITQLVLLFDFIRF